MPNSIPTRARHPPNARPQDDSWVDRVAGEGQALLREHGLKIELCVWYDPITETLHVTDLDGSVARHFRALDPDRAAPDSPAPREDPTVRPEGMEPPSPSVRRMTPSELGEYSFCPRAWWYHRRDALERAGSGADARRDAFASGLQAQAGLLEDHVAPPETHRVRWGTVAALALVLIGDGFVLWTFWW